MGKPLPISQTQSHTHAHSEAIMRRATNVARKNLISLGTCIGKFTKSGKFHLQITALDLLAPYAKVVLHCNQCETYYDYYARLLCQ